MERTLYASRRRRGAYWILSLPTTLPLRRDCLSRYIFNVSRSFSFARPPSLLHRQSAAIQSISVAYGWRCDNLAWLECPWVNRSKHCRLGRREHGRVPARVLGLCDLSIPGARFFVPYQQALVFISLENKNIYIKYKNEKIMYKMRWKNVDKVSHWRAKNESLISIDDLVVDK